MTECIYGMLKKRFPILKHIRTSLSNTIKITIACSILHNIGITYGDIVEYVPGEDEIQDDVVIQQALPPAEAHEVGRQARDFIKNNMPPPTAAERNKMTFHCLGAQIRR